jgi:hypothetical protein
MIIRRTATAAVLALALSAASGPALAAGHGHATHDHSASAHGANGQARRLAAQIAQLDRRLVRLETSHGLTGLDPADQDVLVASIEADRAWLTSVASPAQLRPFRVENYHAAVSVLRNAGELADAAASVPAAQDELDQAVAGALALTALSPRADVHAVRAHLDGAETEVEDASGDSTGGSDDSTDDTTDTTDSESGDQPTT